MPHILMIAAENGALPGGKVGGIGDVVRDIPLALAQHDCTVSVVTPAYGSFLKLPGAKRKKTLLVNYGGSVQSLELYQLSQSSSDTNVHHYVIEHPLFSSCGAGKIYCDDPATRPFATDASKFALFCRAVAEAITEKAFARVDVLHLHDWHAAFLLILRHYIPRYKSMQKIPCAYTIHNLAMQGIRPFEGDESSLQEWYPDLVYDPTQLADPKWTNCVNPMASAIRLADTVHAVSPNYAREILLPGDASLGQSGGEGLDKDLIQANKENRLFGILNGCEYPKGKRPKADAKGWTWLLQQMQDLVLRWAGRSATLASAHFLAHHSLAKLGPKRPQTLLTSVGRITEQKMALMCQPTSSGIPALHAALEMMGDQALMLVIGSGDAQYEQFLCETMSRYTNFIFLCGFSEEIADAFYHQGDLFFMPSSFEPCGISQMLALRAGQPCLVHGVGGLRDTIVDGKTGFVFTGNTPTKQAEAMVSTLKKALLQQRKNTPKWQTMRKNAAAARFHWGDSIEAYLSKLYKISVTVK
ncbi:MAG: starch synthase [Gammaproteobacteria bacterium]|jgi:starch synthase